MATKPTDQYSRAETERRFKAALQGAFNTPAKPLKSIKVPIKKRVTKKKTAK
ncbi:hypothetical protein [Bradyrhizobium sp. Ash2021]|uniref:hypothetical protein n=1 Tax=Bradyrhizobium sp. Ash2021 TaxID=2954771 RepID=UPI00281643BB|nr:hypothetical protein [Bradyrhizobium sp. Ash2021]WMT77365.1 hypothetical protein NL528_13855 [Bradyrhizobium sp. Ash2021]